MKCNFIVLMVLFVSALGVSSSFAQQKGLLKKDQFPGYAFSKETGKTVPDSLFKIEDGHIIMEAEHAGYLVTKKEYRNFKLQAKFRWIVKPGQKPKRNSGVMYYVAKGQEDALWPSGYQYQIKTKSTGDFILLKNTTIVVNDTLCGPGASVGVKHFTDAEKAAGEWNEITVIAKNGVVQQYLNGTLVNEGKDASVEKGRILFQYEGYPIEFKDIFVE